MSIKLQIKFDLELLNTFSKTIKAKDKTFLTLMA